MAASQLINAGGDQNGVGVSHTPTNCFILCILFADSDKEGPYAAYFAPYVAYFAPYVAYFCFVGSSFLLHT